MKKIGVCGHFAFGKECLDGQTIKTKNIAEGLEKALGKEQVRKLDTHGGIKTFIKVLFFLFGFLFQCDTVVLLPAQNGVITLLPLVVVMNFLYRKRLCYVVIGGWIADMIEKKPWLTFFLKRLSGIYVETAFMKAELELKHLNNVEILLNPKNLTPISEDEIKVCSEPLALCTFSRVMEEKGIEDAIRAVRQINREKTFVTLDIYGQIDALYEERFSELKTRFPESIRYCGKVSFEQAVEVLRKYDLQLFPTKFRTEGIPGSVIDGYFSGVPVLSARWESFSDIIDEGVTGIGYELGSSDGLTDRLLRIAENPDTLNSMKESCLNYSERFLPETAVKILIREFY